MYLTLCKVERDPDGTRKEEEASKRSKSVMREHEGAELIPYHYQHKGFQAIIKRAIYKDLRDMLKTLIRQGWRDKDC